MSCLSSAEK